MGWGGCLVLELETFVFAGSHGKLADGRQVQCDMQTAQAIKSCYVALSDVLSSAQMVEHFERHFIPAVASDMAGTHSFASASMSHLSHSAWMMPGDAATAMVGAASSTASSAESKPAETNKAIAEPKEKTEQSKLERLKTHYERQIKQMKESFQRKSRAGPSSQQFNDRRSGRDTRDERAVRFTDREDGERNNQSNRDRTSRG